MRMKPCAQPPAEYDAWVAEQKAPPAVPDSRSLAGKGHMLCAQSACIACHTIEGVSAGIVGPNLTHLASRTTFAGALFPNDAEHLGKWIANAPAQKPGSIMPALGLPADQVTAIVAYLQSLR